MDIHRIKLIAFLIFFAIGGRRDLSIQYPHGGNHHTEPYHLHGIYHCRKFDTPHSLQAHHLHGIGDYYIGFVMMTNVPHHLHGIDLSRGCSYEHTQVPHHLHGIDLLIFLHPPMVVAPHHLHGIDLRKPVTVWNGVTGDCNRPCNSNTGIGTHLITHRNDHF